MLRSSTAALAASLLVTCALTPALAQSTSNGAEPGKTRAQVIAERDEWLRTHRWDHCLDDWVVKDEFKTPDVMCTRDEVRKERDEWLRTHRWDPGADAWVPLRPQRHPCIGTGVPAGAAAAADPRAEHADPRAGSQGDPRVPAHPRVGRFQQFLEGKAPDGPAQGLTRAARPPRLPSWLLGLSAIRDRHTDGRLSGRA